MSDQTNPQPEQLDKLEAKLEDHAKAQVLKFGFMDWSNYLFPIFINGSSYSGVTKREAVAALALMGLMDAEFQLTPADAAAKSVAYADALIAALATPQP